MRLSLFAEVFRREEEIQDEPTGKLHQTAVCTLVICCHHTLVAAQCALPSAENDTFYFPLSDLISPSLPAVGELELSNNLCNLKQVDSVLIITSRCGECAGYNLSNKIFFICWIVYLMSFEGVRRQLLTSIVFAEQLVSVFLTTHNNRH